MNSSLMNWTEEEVYLVSEYAYGLHLEGHDRDAAVIFEGLLAIDPDNIYCRDALAGLSLALGRPEQASRYASELLNIVPNHPDSLARRCEAFLQLGRFEEAQHDLDALRRSHAVAHSRRMQLRLETAAGLTSPSNEGVLPDFFDDKRSSSGALLAITQQTGD